MGEKASVKQPLVLSCSTSKKDKLYSLLQYSFMPAQLQTEFAKCECTGNEFAGETGYKIPKSFLLIIFCGISAMERRKQMEQQIWQYCDIVILL